jgi:preprotein translocase subunit YajC
MDFIEQLFGLSPDNGDGSTEIMWLVVLAIAIAAFMYFRIQRRRARR